MWLATWILAAVRASMMAGALLLTFHAAADPARLDGLQMAGHDAVDPGCPGFPPVARSQR